MFWTLILKDRLASKIVWKMDSISCCELSTQINRFVTIFGNNGQHVLLFTKYDKSMSNFFRKKDSISCFFLATGIDWFVFNFAGEWTAFLAFFSKPNMINRFVWNIFGKYWQHFLLFYKASMINQFVSNIFGISLFSIPNVIIDLCQKILGKWTAFPAFFTPKCDQSICEKSFGQMDIISCFSFKPKCDTSICEKSFGENGQYFLLFFKPKHDKSICEKSFGKLDSISSFFLTKIWKTWAPPKRQKKQRN